MLLEHLSKIKTEDKYLYRGMDKDHVQKEVGEVWEPGAFTSASSNPNVATKFATDYNSEKSGMTILRMKTKSGRSIR